MDRATFYEDVDVVWHYFHRFDLAINRGGNLWQKILQSNGHIIDQDFASILGTPDQVVS
jgi:hypothetical protein